MLIVTGLVFLLLLVISVLFIRGKGGALLAGYNTMSKDQKAKYDEKALLRFMGYLLLTFNILFTLGMIGASTGIMWLSTVGFIASLVILFGGIIYSNTGKRFQKPDAEISDSDEPPSKTPLISTIVILAVTIAAVSVLFYFGYREPAISIGNNSIAIEAMYGLTVSFDNITDISLVEDSMNAIMGSGSRRTNGFGGIGDANKGEFTSSRTGDVLLFTKSNASPTIRIERAGNTRDIYISFRDSTETRALYQELLAAN